MKSLLTRLWIIQSMVLGFMAALMATGAAAVAQCLSWQQPILNCPSIPCRPSPRAGHAMAFDNDTGNVLLFGGESHNDAMGDTWVYNLTNNSASWARVLILGSSPPPTSEAAMVYDSARHRFVLFGGVNADGYSDRTWVFEYRGNFTGVWSELSPPTRPPSRAGHAMTFDTNRNVAVLFGGEHRDQCQFCPDQFDDTWEWDGTAWHQLTPTQKPHRRVRHSMTWDSQRGVTVLFGGTEPAEFPEVIDEFNDTWEWNGVDWVPVTTTSPPTRRQQHTIAYDSQRAVLVMFGGASKFPNSIGDDTDEYYGPAGWQSLFASGPPPRARHAMVYDSIHEKMVLFGGASDDTQYNDTWELVVNGPQFIAHPQNVSASACSSVSFSSVATGGVGPLQYQWRKDGRNLSDDGRIAGVTTTSLQVNSVRFADTGVYQLVATSPCGESTSIGASLKVDGPWYHHAVTGPEARHNSGMAYDEGRRVTVLFGGFTSSGAVGRDTWEWNGNTWVLRSTGGPTARWGHAMVYDEARRKVVLVGGTRNRADDPADFSNETWEWDGTRWTLRTTRGPGPRAFPALAYDSVARRTVLYGGGNGSQNLYDTWEYDGETAVWTQVLNGWPAGTPLSGRQPRMAFDSARGKRVLFDFYSVGIFDPQMRVFEWDGTGWSRVNPLPDPDRKVGRVPSPAFEFGVAFHRVRRLVVFNNGTDAGNSFPQATWGYDGAFWRMLDISTGPPRYADGGMVYDISRRALVQFGGAFNELPGIRGETWERVDADTPQIVHGPDARIAPLGAVQLSITVRGQPPYQFQWRRNGIPLADNAEISGAAGGLLTMRNPQAARYDVVVSGPCGETTSDAVAVPLPGTTAIGAGGTRLTLSREQTQWRLRWPDLSARLFASLQVTGTWTQVSGATSPHSIATDLPQQFFRLQGGRGCAGIPDGLVAWWRAETNAADYTGENGGTLQGGLGFPEGLVGRAFSFSGAGQGVSIAPSASLNLGTNEGFTIEGWINPADAITPIPLVEWWGVDGFSFVPGVHLWLSGAYGGSGGPGAIYFSLDGRGDPAAVIATPPGLITSNSWQHVAAVYVRSDPVYAAVALYLNGDLVASQSIPPAITPRTQFPLYLGMRPGRNFYRGLFDEFSLYRRALSPDEIKSIYLAQGAGKCQSTE